MIRFRLGQSWKRERGAAPVDAFGLELEGVDVLAQATEESLEAVVAELVEAVHGLSVRGERLGQVSLAEANLELCFARHGGSVELQIAALSRPARLVRRLELELADLRQATTRCARALLLDLSERSAEAADRLAKRMARRLSALEHGPAAPDPPSGGPGFEYRAEAPETLGFGFRLSDPEDRLRAFRARGPGPLASLLCGGELWLELQGDRLWNASGPPALVLTELTRQAMELASAAETQEPISFQLGGEGAAWRFGEKMPPPCEPLPLARAMCELGLAFAFAVSSRHRSQARNPYLIELSERCREALAHLKEAPAPEEGGVARAAKIPTPGRPLAPGRKLKRLRFEPRWVKQNLGGETPGALYLGPKGPVFASPEMACGFSRNGQLLFRRVATNGVAVDGAGHVLAATASRVCGYSGSEPSARWLRDHDGLPLGPELVAREGRWLTVADNRTVIAFDAMIGRELWRLAPPRTSRCFLSIQAHRALVATDSGYLYGLDLADGQVRYRLKSSLPFASAMLPWGRRAVGALSRGEASAVLVSDAHKGTVSWAHELKMPLASNVLASRTRVLVACTSAGEGVLVCLTSSGERAWERRVPVGPGPYALAALERATLVSARTGAAALIDSDGRVRWRVGAAGEQLSWSLEPQRSRGLLLLPGRTVRAVDPGSGEVLGEVAASPGLCDLAASSRLEVYLLDEDGTLSAFRLGTHLSVVPSR